MDIEAMQDFFNKTPVQLPKALSYKEKHQLLLHYIRGDWYMKKMRSFHP